MATPYSFQELKECGMRGLRGASWTREEGEGLKRGGHSGGASPAFELRSNPAHRASPSPSGGVQIVPNEVLGELFSL